MNTVVSKLAYVSLEYTKCPKFYIERVKIINIFRHNITHNIAYHSMMVIRYHILFYYYTEISSHRNSRYIISRLKLTTKKLNQIWHIFLFKLHFLDGL